MTIRRTLLAAVAVFLCTTIAHADIIDLSAVIDGSQEVPPSGSAGTGSAVLTFDTSSNVLSWDISWSGLAGIETGLHLHNAPAGMNGPIEVNIGAISGLTSPSIGSAVLTASQASEVLANRTYINLHTDVDPAGEIRGQVLLAPSEIPTVSEWGLIVLALLVLTSGTIVLRREMVRGAAA